MHDIWDAAAVQEATRGLTAALQEAEPDLQLAVGPGGAVHPQSLAENLVAIRGRLMAQQRTIFVLMAVVDSLFQQSGADADADAPVAAAAIEEFAEGVRQASAQRPKKSQIVVPTGAQVPKDIRGG